MLDRRQLLAAGAAATTLSSTMAISVMSVPAGESVSVCSGAKAATSTSCGASALSISAPISASTSVMG